MSPRYKRLDDADGQHRQQRDDKQVRRHHERKARFAHPTQVNERDQRQDHKAEREGVGLEHADRRDQGPDTRRDADGHDQHVVQQQRRGGEQAGRGAQVLLGDRVRPAAVRVRGDRLAVRKVDDKQQDDDQRADRPDVRNAGRAQGDQQRQRSLRPVSRGTKCVEPEHGNAGEYTDALLPFFIRRQPPPEEIVNQGHH